MEPLQVHESCGVTVVLGSRVNNQSPQAGACFIKEVSFGSHCILQSLSCVWLLYANPMDSAHWLLSMEFFQATILEWATFSLRDLSTQGLKL